MSGSTMVADQAAGTGGHGSPRSFAETLVSANTDLWRAMERHPWVQALAAGTLPESALTAWAQQCRLFCIMEKQALLTLLSYAPKPELYQLLAKLVDDTDREPRQLAEMLAGMGQPVPDESWPICRGYGSQVQAAARTGLTEGLTAVFAVERAYLDTWTSVLPSCPPGSRWRSWVENWSCAEFRETVIGLGRCLDELAGSPTDLTLSLLHPVFRSVAQWEHAFWEMCWQQQAWPALEGAQE